MLKGPFIVALSKYTVMLILINCPKQIESTRMYCERVEIQEKGIILAQVFCILFAFFLPISVSIKSIFLIPTLLLLLILSFYNKQLAYTFNTIWGRAAIAFFVFIIIACFWSEAPYSMQWMIVGKYLKIIYLPILAVGFINPKLRFWTVNSYLAAIGLTCVLALLKAKGIIHLKVDQDLGHIFYNHIVTGFMVAFGSYLAGLFAYRYTGWPRVVYVCLLLLTSYEIIFINNGRTGYLVYFILMILLLAQILPLKKALLGIAIFCSLFLLSYFQSAVMQTRVASFITDVKLLQQNKENTSVGFRVQFHNYAQSLFMTQPLVGIGTGGFKYSYSRDNPVPSWGAVLNEPHSQYWMSLCEQGIIGFLLLLCLLGSLFITSFKLNESRPILFGILVVFCIAALTDTILCYSILGYLLILMSALSVGELVEQQSTK